MKKLTRCLLLAMAAVFLFTSVALAVDELVFRGGRVFPDGYMYLMFNTSYTNAEDLNFEATTGKGIISVESAYVLRDRGTSWFVLLDYGRNEGNSEYVMQTQDAVLKGLAELVGENDDGALITISETPEINVTNGTTLRENLLKTPGTSQQSALVGTLSKTLNFINENRSALMPKISIVVITTARSIDASVPDQVDQLFLQGNNVDYTTHIICTAGSEKNFGASRGGWRDKAAQLSSKALRTVGGTAFVTDLLNAQEAGKAVQRVKDAECSLVRLELNPLRKGVIDSQITVAQVTSGGKRLETTITLNEESVQMVQEAIKGKKAPVEHSYASAATSTFIVDSYEPAPKKTGLSIELIVAIALGVVIVALVVVLIVLRARGGKKKEEQVYAASTAQQPVIKTTVRLTGKDGRVLTGVMSGGRLTVGRDPGRARLVITDDKKVSGLHMTLSLQGNVMTLTDNNSTNGVAVNGTRVTGSCQVQQNDTIALGSNVYTLSWRRA